MVCSVGVQFAVGLTLMTEQTKGRIFEDYLWYHISVIKGPIGKLMYGLDYKFFLVYWAGWRVKKLYYGDRKSMPAKPQAEMQLQ